jgi:hypothetical protein
MSAAVDEPRKPIVKKLSFAIATSWLAFAAGLLRIGLEDGHVAGPMWAIVLAVSACVVIGIASGLLAYIAREILTAMQGVAVLFTAFTLATPHENVKRPLFLSIAGIVILMLLVGGAVPLLVLVWRSTRDERERAIFATATSLAFGTTMVVVAAFSLLGHRQFSTLQAPDLTPTWILFAGIGSWLGSMLVLRRRM